jgi:hypothetical protein
MMSLKALARFKPQTLPGQCEPGRINQRLTTFVEEALTRKIYPILTINVPFSFEFKAESATRAA